MTSCSVQVLHNQEPLWSWAEPVLSETEEGTPDMWNIWHSLLVLKEGSLTRDKPWNLGLVATVYSALWRLRTSPSASLWHGNPHRCYTRDPSDSSASSNPPYYSTCHWSTFLAGAGMGLAMKKCTWPWIELYLYVTKSKDLAISIVACIFPFWHPEQYSHRTFGFLWV